MNYNESRISTLCDCTIHINRAKSTDDSLRAVDIHVHVTVLTISTRIDQSTHSNMISNLEALSIGTHLFNDSDNLMPVFNALCISSVRSALTAVIYHQCVLLFNEVE